MTTMTLERPFPTAFEQEFTPLMPGEGLGEQADAYLEQLAEYGFVAARGMHLEQATHLAGIAADPKVEEWCPNDYARRFGTIGRQRAWVAKNGGRAMLGIYSVDGSRGPLGVADMASLSTYDVAMVADAWGGVEPNEHIPGADVTTAYRVGSVGSFLARERRVGEADRFSLGIPLGFLTIANLVRHHGVPAEKVSLETWEGNVVARGLYEALGFREVEGVPRLAAVRPTLQPAGTIINGHEVRYQTAEDGTQLPTREVDDRRVFQVLRAFAA